MLSGRAVCSRTFMQMNQDDSSEFSALFESTLICLRLQSCRETTTIKKSPDESG